MAKFEYKESHKHRLAKELLASWLMDAETKGVCIKKINHATATYARFAQFEWKCSFGVFTELKFYESSSNTYYFRYSKGLIKNEEGFVIQINKDPLSWFDPNFDRGKILFVPDIVVFHEGMPKYLFEIKHRNPVSEKKVKAIFDFFKDHPIELYEIEAEEILRHCDVPDELKATELFEY